jgi:CubicO group peptidase (beta-lactamase class C family)
MPSIARACIVLLALSVLPTRAFAEPPDFSALDAAASDAVASGEIPGAVILVGQGSRILYHRAFGLRQVVPSAEPMTEDTVFDLASLTKPLGTTLAVMSLAERGRIRLDAPLGAYLREFRGRAFREVTIRRILAHRAGFCAWPRSRSTTRRARASSTATRALSSSARSCDA